VGAASAGGGRRTARAADLRYPPSEAGAVAGGGRCAAVRRVVVATVGRANGRGAVGMLRCVYVLAAGPTAGDCASGASARLGISVAGSARAARESDAAADPARRTDSAAAHSAS